MGSTLMAQILPFVRRCKIFGPDATLAMGEAYDKAIGTIHPNAESQFVVRELKKGKAHAQCHQVGTLADAARPLTIAGMDFRLIYVNGRPNID
jgi:hypothetical protein